MQNKTGKRSSERGIGRRDGYTQDLFCGVGARQTPPLFSAGGGGYQNICNVLNFDASAAEKKRDPRLEELREMGLQRIWLEIAEEIGVDVLLRIWRILDNDPASIGDSGRLILPLCRYSTYLRYQRNRYTEALHAAGMSVRDIQKKLNEQLCEQISIRHISRLLKSE